MSDIIEVKAMSKEEALKRALKILDAKEENLVKITEKKKSMSFLGIFSREGIYEIEIDKNKKMAIPKSKNNDVSSAPKETIKKSQIQSKNIDTTKSSEEEKKYDTVEKVKSESINENEDISDKIKKESKILLEKMSLNLVVSVSKTYERTYLVNLSGEDNGIIIGKKGKTLNSFEYLLNSIFKRCRIEVDVEGFKEKRYETLRELGRKMAEKAIKTHKTIRLNPMPSRERKIIHEVVNKYPELDTFSEGKDPKRYIVIKKKK